MRHRIASGFGIGNANPPLLDNKGSVNTSYGFDAIKKYFQKYEGFDYQVSGTSVAVGIEPGYQYEPLLIVCICKNKSKSYIQRGKAWGAYGTQLVTTTKYYKDYKKKSKFIKFVDKWHKVLFKDTYVNP